MRQLAPAGELTSEEDKRARREARSRIRSKAGRGHAHCTISARGKAEADKLGGMVAYVHFYPDAESKVPARMKDVVARLVDRSKAIRATQGHKGGLKRPDLAGAVGEALDMHPRRAAGRTFAAGQLDFEIASARLAVAVQAGRAWMNNDALLSVLAAASDPAIDWLVLVVPQKYLGGGQYPYIVKQLQALASSSGVDLELQAVAIIPY